jgi:hypothetical protein
MVTLRGSETFARPQTTYKLVVFKDGEGLAIENKPDVLDALHIHIQFPVKSASLGLGDLQFLRDETQEAAIKTSLGTLVKGHSDVVGRSIHM